MARGDARASRTAASVTEVNVARSTGMMEFVFGDLFGLFFEVAGAGDDDDDDDAAATAAPNSPPSFSSRLAPRALSSSSTCQLIASPSRSGSVASTTLPVRGDVASSASSSSLLRAAGAGASHRSSNPELGSTELPFARSRTCPKVARTLAELPRYCWILRALAGDSTMTKVMSPEAVFLVLLAEEEEEEEEERGGVEVVEAGVAEVDGDDDVFAPAAAAAVLIVAAIGPRGARVEDDDDIARAASRDVEDGIARAASNREERRSMAMPAATLGCIRVAPAAKSGAR